MKNIVKIENNELVVTISDISKFSGNNEKSVKRLVKNKRKSLEDIKPLGRYSDSDIDYNSIAFNKKQTELILSFIDPDCSYSDIKSFINGNKESTIKKTRRYIYFIKDGNFVKIGIATDIRKRLSSIQNGNPRKLKLLYCELKENASEVEKILHKKFKHLRGLGEWFNFEKEDVNLAINYSKVV